MNITNSKKVRKSKFCQILNKILDNQDYQDKITWFQDGFAVFNIERLEKEVLVHYFKHHKYSSFMRQLNGYGFYQKERNHEMTYYCHKQMTTINKQNIKVLKKQEKIKIRNELMEEHQQIMSELFNIKKEQYKLEKLFRINLKIREIITLQIKQGIEQYNRMINEFRDNFQKLLKNELIIDFNSQRFPFIQSIQLVALMYSQLMNQLYSQRIHA